MPSDPTAPALRTARTPAPRGRPFSPGNPLRYLPGRSPNPGGRPAGVARYIRRKCGKQYQQVIDGLHTVAFGSPADHAQLFGAPVTVSMRDRLEAWRMLLERGLGPPHVVGDPLAAAEAGPQIVITIPRPQAELAGRTVVYDEDA